MIPLLLLCSCSGRNKADTPLSDLTENNACTHEYNYPCDEKCSLCGEKRENFEKHTYNSTSRCRNIVCTVCNAVKEQSHNYVPTDYSLENQPTLVSGKTVTERCTKCRQERDKQCPALTPEDVGLSAVYLTDYRPDTTIIKDLQKPEEIVVKLKYESNSDSVKDFECVSKIKVQGASSSYLPKKNYTIKLFEDDTLAKKHNVDLGWGKQNKYCLKANYIDSSQARNIVGARLSAQAAATRSSINPYLADSPNYGLIDGFPILVYVNGEFHGLYTLNIPKDNWQFSMKTDESLRQALLMADAWTDSVKMKEPIGSDLTASGWDIEHCSTADESWIRESFNELIELLNCGDPERIRQELPAHLDVDAAIDNFILTYTMNAGDNQSKNILWATYDGEIWIPSMYDMDATFGMWWNGTPIGTPGVETRNMYPSWNEGGSYYLPNNASKMYHILIQCYGDEIQARWTELRKDIITTANITNLFDEFFDGILDIVYYSDSLLWPEVPYIEENRSNMYDATREQIERLDDFFYNMDNATQ